MKRLLFLFVMYVTVLTMHSQRYAVLEFQAAKGISVSDVDGISDMFLTYFNPQGYTGVDRGQLNRILAEQNLQHSDVTEEIAVRIGRINNISKVVLGKVSRLGGGYQVDVRVVDVESSRIYAKDGETVTGNFRAGVSALAKRLASKIAIRQSSPVPPTATTTSSPHKRTSVDTLYGYLKIFPNELGTFQSEPTSVIAQINKQAKHGFNNWRIPTDEELSLLKANNYIGSGEYMTSGNRRGIVLLVTDGKDFVSLQAEKQKQELMAAELKAKLERRNTQLKAQGFVDLGLPSGTWWKDKNENESGKFYSYNDAIRTYDSSLPTEKQFNELSRECSWKWKGDGYKIVGPNGNSIFLPLAGMSENRYMGPAVGYGWETFWDRTGYWTSESDKNDYPIYFYFYSSYRASMSGSDIKKCNIRLVKKP